MRILGRPEVTMGTLGTRAMAPPSQNRERGIEEETAPPLSATYPLLNSLLPKLPKGLDA